MDVDGKMVRTTVPDEEDYCSPPLAMKREAVLDRYFTEINVEKIPDEQANWNKISSLPKAW